MDLLIVVDMQNDFIDGALGNDETKAIVPKVCKLIKKYEDKNPTMPVFCTYDTHEQDYLETQEGKKLPVPHCIWNTKGWELNMDVADAIGIMAETPICKGTFGAIDLNFVITDELMIDNPAGIKEIETITLCGVCTDICVISNAMILKAFYPEAEIRVVSDCCAGVTPESHERALEAMKMCQIDIVQLGDVFND